jgi:hypothetical protein
MNLVVRSEADFRDNPVLFVELARNWAAGGPPPDPEHEEWLRQCPRPLIVRPAAAREALWAVLACPERARALAWLDRAGILEEILPSWSGDYFRQSLRLQAVEQVHLEPWAEGLSETAYDWLCVYEDQLVDGRLSGWALTGLATLLLSGDEPADAFATRVAKDLKALGATAAERERVAVAIREYPELYDAILSCTVPSRSFSPVGIVATLSTLWVIPDLNMDLRLRAAQCADRLLSRHAAPEERSVRPKESSHR